MSSKDEIDQHVLEIAKRKKTWDAGPWQDEPDRVEWRSRSGLPCLIVRNHLGVLCGYVGVPPGHPLHGQHYADVPLDAHGGLTYSDACRGGICHVPAPGEPDAAWWFGFDCGHAFDLVPGMPDGLRLARDWTYRDVAYVTHEVNQLAEQIERQF